MPNQQSAIKNPQSDRRFNGRPGTKKPHETIWLADYSFGRSAPKYSYFKHDWQSVTAFGSSVGANYRAACRGRSKPDFVSKVGIAIEEADESLYWMEMLIESGILPEDRLATLMQEANELIAIFTASVKTVRNHNSRK